jgi:hypothetical protein
VAALSDESTIRRGARNARYTTVPNDVFEDVRLSMEARWLIGYLLSKPDNWTVCMSDIARKGDCGRDKVRKMVNELVEFGYAEKEQGRDDGRFGKLWLVIYDEPKLPPARNVGAPDDSVAFLPQTEKPSTVNPSTVKPSLVKTDNLAIPEDREERERGREEGLQEGQPASADDPRKFEHRVKKLAADLAWPRWAKSSTDWTIAQFAKLTDAERAEAERRAPQYRAETGGGSLSLGTYFAERKWVDLPEPTPDAPSMVEVRPFGPGWAELCLREIVLKRPEAWPAPASGFLRELLERDDEAGRRERLARQATYGWPQVKLWYEAAANRRSTWLKPEDARFCAAMEAVPVDSAVFGAWRELYERNGWPWLPDPGAMRVVYFPAGGPEAFPEFTRLIKSGNGRSKGIEEAA